MAVHPSARRPKTSLAGFKKAATTAKAKKPGFQVTHGGKTMGFHKAQLTSDAKAKLQSAAKKDADHEQNRVNDGQRRSRRGAGRCS